jgi:hypothetical protein
VPELRAIGRRAAFDKHAQEKNKAEIAAAMTPASDGFH